MPRPKPGNDPPIVPDLGRTVAVMALIELAHRQIDAGLSRAKNIDSQAIGLIGLDVGLIAIAFAAHGALGPHYWVAIPGLAVSILIAGSVLAVTRFDIGPRPGQLYAKIEAAELSGDQARARLLTDLVATEIDNQRPLRSKALRLLIAIGALLFTILYTTILIVL
jgi:hypothetical protein